MGGCDERLFGQHKAEEIAALTRNTLKRMKDIPFVLAPDCSLATNTYDEEPARLYRGRTFQRLIFFFSLPPVCMLTDCMNREFCLSASCERADRRWEERKDYGGRELLLCAQIRSDPELYPAKIESGEYTAGDKIPSEIELARQFDVSRLTVNTAVKEPGQQRHCGAGTG